MGLFSKLSTANHVRKLLKAEKQARKNRKLVLKYQELEDRQNELEKVRKGGLSDKGLRVLANIKAEKAKIRTMRIAKAKKVARIAAGVAVSITKDIHELGGRIDKKKPRKRMVKKRRKKRKSIKPISIKSLL